MIRFSSIFLFFLICCNLSAQDYIWLEGESPTTVNSRNGVNDGWAHEFFSAGKWLHVSVDAGKVGSDVPNDGVVLKYVFDTKKAGSYELWNRIGLEFVRSPFDWRVDNGPWKTVSPEQLTVDLMEVSFWCEVAWLRMENVQLSQGRHTLEIRLQKRFKNEEKKEYDRILYASDAICFCAGGFVPNGKFRPDEEYRTERDEQAAARSIAIPPLEGGERVTFDLKGDWEVCRADEQLPGPVAEPIPASDLPNARSRWSAIAVPSDKNVSRPDLKFAHRLWYRTHFDVAADASMGSIFLEFPQNNLNTTVYVNGKLCGFEKNPFARFRIDITRAVMPGHNEILVGIRDAWYARRADPKDPMVLRKTFNFPVSFFNQGFQDFVYPVWNLPQSGILVTPKLVCVSRRAYVRDVFIRPRVAEKRLDVEISVLNTSHSTAKCPLQWVAFEDGKTDGNPAKTSDVLNVEIPANSEKTFTLSAPWPNAKLWSPEDPNLYQLRISLRDEISYETFGFREWSTSGKNFLLNGKPYHAWADCFTAPNPEEWLKFYRESNQRVMRFWGTSWQGLPPEEALAFFDRSGVPVRRSGIFDGEAIGYNVIKDDVLNTELFQNWRDQICAQVRGERNHPSIMLWSLENEVLYINCINLYGGHMDKFEAETTRTAQAVKAVDPTRPAMVDGGGACLNNSLEVQGDHYVFTDYTRYPDLAYESNPTGGGRGRWTWDEKRPRFIGEDYFANGINPFDFAWIGGEETFQGKASTRRAAGLIYRMLTEGYRWAGYGGWHFWMSQNEAVGQYASNAPIAVFCREYDWTFASNLTVRRTLKLFNDSEQGRTLVVKWGWSDGLPEQGGSREFNLQPGTSQEFTIDLKVPDIGTAARKDARWLLTVSTRSNGKSDTVFQDSKPASILTLGKTNVRPSDLLVYDPSGSTVCYLQKSKIEFTKIENLDELPARGKVLLVGKDAITPEICDSARFRAFAESGRAVVVLEQKVPLRFQALPGEVELSENEGSIAFMENETHPVFRNLRQKDFFTWANGHTVYRNAYVKPQRGARSLLQCGNRLANSALMEFPVGQGVMIVSQLVLTEKLDASPVPRQLLANLLQYAAGYRQTFVATTLYDRDTDPQFAHALDEMQLKFHRSQNLSDALKTSGILIVPASKRNLEQLTGAQAGEVTQFLGRGGRIVLHGLKPDALEAYSRFVGVEHQIREFRRERVLFSPKKHVLTEGLTLGDITMRSGERIFGWTADEYVASDVFSYVVDLEDVAPFAKRCFEVEQLTNGMFSADAWKYIHNFDALDAPPDDRIVFHFQKPIEIVEVTWVGNTFYYPVTRFGLFFDGKKDMIQEFGTKPTNDPQTFAISPSLSGKDLTIRLSEWEILPEKAKVTGLDNISLRQKRSDEYYRKVFPLVNVGGLVEYRVNRGSILLCNLKFQATEAVPENGVKKRTILGNILRNMNAEFAQGRTIVASERLTYTPVTLADACNRFRKEVFGDANRSFAGMPSGEQKFAGVRFEIYEFPTSPVPNCIELGRDGVNSAPAIPVGRRADALFFLHAMRLDARRNGDEVKNNVLHEALVYVVEYADGQTVEVPANAEVQAENYVQKDLQPVPGAQIGWVGKLGNSGESAVAYVQQWTNPRPEVEIRAIQVRLGKSPRGPVAVFAISSAEIAK